MNAAKCFDCDRPYGDEHGFPDLVIDDAAWKQIAPFSDGHGLLCPSCICKRLSNKGIICKGRFTSGPLSGADSRDAALRGARAEIERLRARLQPSGDDMKTAQELVFKAAPLIVPPTRHRIAVAVAAAIAAAREACARICDDRGEWAASKIESDDDVLWSSYSNASNDCAEMIRARSRKEEKA